jgi:CelD/BcsL family acetyltransferase involved in cellulose biosynthesis
MREVVRDRTDAAPTLVRRVTDLTELEATWRRLEPLTPGLTAFQTWEWVMAWWQTLGRRRPVYVVETQRDGTTIALSCLARSRLGFGTAAFELLTPVGQDLADAGRLTMGDLEGGGRTLLDAIGELCGRRLRVLNIPRLRDDGDEHSLVTSHDWAPRLRLTEETRSVCPVLVYETLADPATHVAATAKRRSVPRLRRRLAELGEVTIELRTPVADGFDELLAVYDARWIDRHDEQGLFASPRSRDFARQAAASLERRDALWLSMVRVDGRPIAGCMGYVVGRRYLYHKPAFDPEYARFKPGHLLISELATEHVALGVRELDFGRGAAEYKDRWATARHDVVSYSLSPVGRMHGVARRLRHASMALAVRDQRGGPSARLTTSGRDRGRVTSR